MKFTFTVTVEDSPMGVQEFGAALARLESAVADLPARVAAKQGGAITQADLDVATERVNAVADAVAAVDADAPATTGNTVAGETPVPPAAQTF